VKEGKNPPILKKIAAGIITGALGISVANPTVSFTFLFFKDVVKVRLQGQDHNNPKYSSMIDCYKKIVQEDGVKGLWRGWGPNVVRNSTFNAAELAGYD
jgi:solute carrier family 25 uncoupling protein 8/9